MTFGDKQLIFLDSETCGFHGMMVLLQWAQGEGGIKLWDIWKKPVHATLKLLEWVADNIVVGFNLTFDWFHVAKIHTIWSLLPGDWIPQEHIDEIALLEAEGRDGNCIKPYSALDLMIFGQRGPYQSLMPRKDIIIRRVPLKSVVWDEQEVPLAHVVACYLERNIELDGMHFAKRFDPDAPKWTVQDRHKEDGSLDRDFADVCLRFKPETKLKTIARYALKFEDTTSMDEIGVAAEYLPYELGFAPVASQLTKYEAGWTTQKVSANGKSVELRTWPAVIQHHIDHWSDDQDARRYATNDIVYTRALYHHFGDPDHGDTDSIIACMVACVRWRGFTIDEEGLKENLKKSEGVAENSPINTNVPNQIRTYLGEMMNEKELQLIRKTTEKPRLERVKALLLPDEELCTKCFGMEPGCKRCDGSGQVSPGLHPAAARADEVLKIKIAKKEIENYNKLLLAGRFHVSLNVTGTLSNRMSGRDGLNAHGIKKSKEVRGNFPLSWGGDYVLCGGDFDGFEVAIADAVYDDLDLRRQIVSGKKIHALFGTLMFPGHTYEQILESDDFPERFGNVNMYGKSKSGVFAMIFGGDDSTLHRRQGVSEEVAKQAYDQWGEWFPGIATARERVLEAHQPLKQPGGRGTKIFWHDPQEYVESFLGFRRYFTLEYKIVRAIVELANNIPEEWKTNSETVVRYAKAGPQMVHGALVSALYGAAFGVSDGVVRAAANHEIQSPGAEITKAVQLGLWEMQPMGVHKFVVAPMNVHDEVMSVTHKDYVDRGAQIVKRVVEGFRSRVPLIGMTWYLNMENWAKKDDKNQPHVPITYNQETALAEIEALSV